MRYKQIQKGIFNDSPNSFITHVWVEDVLETVHVKNTGRCKELLLPGAEVILEISDYKSQMKKLLKALNSHI